MKLKKVLTTWAMYDNQTMGKQCHIRTIKPLHIALCWVKKKQHILDDCLNRRCSFDEPINIYGQDILVALNKLVVLLILPVAPFEQCRRNQDLINDCNYEWYRNRIFEYGEIDEPRASICRCISTVESTELRDAEHTLWR